MSIRIYRSNSLEADVISSIEEGLRRIYGLEIVDGGVMRIPGEARGRHTIKEQYDAAFLLHHLIERGAGLALWVIGEDLYVDGMNFVFGYGCPSAAILSVHRLHSQDLEVKEAVHEVGHALGLGHCSHECVMQYSNSLAEAERKPSALCATCRAKVGKARLDPRCL